MVEGEKLSIKLNFSTWPLLTGETQKLVAQVSCGTSISIGTLFILFLTTTALWGSEESQYIGIAGFLVIPVNGQKPLPLFL
jgi:hypothetical protein